MQNKDNINPDHYKSETSLECIEAMEIIFGPAAVIDFAMCNAWKYIWRWKHKNGLEDLYKARWYTEHAYGLIPDDTDISDERIKFLNNLMHYICKNIEETEDKMNE